MTNVINTIVKATATSLVVSVKTQEGVDAHVFKIEDKGSKGVLGQFDKLIKLIERQLIENEVVLIDATPLKGVFKALREKSRDGKIFRLWAKGKGLIFKLVNEGMFTLEDKHRQVTVWKDGYSPAVTEITEVAEKVTTQLLEKEVEMNTNEVNVNTVKEETVMTIQPNYKIVRHLENGTTYTSVEFSTLAPEELSEKILLEDTFTTRVEILSINDEVLAENHLITSCDNSETLPTPPQPTEDKEMKVNSIKRVGHLTDATAKTLAVDFKWLNIQPGKSFTAGEWSIYAGLAEISGKLNKAKGLHLNKVRVLKREAIEVEKKELTSMFPKGVEGEVAVLLCGKDSSITLESSIINNRDIFIGDVTSFKFSKMSLPNTTHIVLFWNEEAVSLKAPLDFTKVVSEPEQLTKADWVSEWKNPVKKLLVKGTDRKTHTVYFEDGMFCSSEGKVGEKLHKVLGTQVLEVRDEDKNLISLTKEGKWEIISAEKEEAEPKVETKVSEYSEEYTFTAGGKAFTSDDIVEMTLEMDENSNQMNLWEEKVSFQKIEELRARLDVITFTPNTDVLGYGICIGYEMDIENMIHYGNAMLANPTHKGLFILEQRMNAFEEACKEEMEESRDIIKYLETHSAPNDSVWTNSPTGYAFAMETLEDYQVRVRTLNEVLGL